MSLFSIPRPGILAVLLLAFATLYAPFAQASNEPVFSATLVEFEGDVTLMKPDEDLWLPVDTDIPLEQGDRLRTGADGSAEILLDDGSVVRMEENTDLTLEELVAGHGESRLQSRVALFFGRLLFNIRSLVSRDSRFEVKTPTLVAAVRGTEFVVDTGAGEEGDVGVFEGTVAVQGLDLEGRPIQGSEVLLPKGTQTSVARFKRPGKPVGMKQRMLGHRNRMEQIRKKAADRRKRLPRILEKRKRALDRMLNQWQRLRKTPAGKGRPDRRPPRLERKGGGGKPPGPPRGKGPKKKP